MKLNAISEAMTLHRLEQMYGKPLTEASTGTMVTRGGAIGAALGALGLGLANLAGWVQAGIGAFGSNAASGIAVSFWQNIWILVKMMWTYGEVTAKSLAGFSAVGGVGGLIAGLLIGGMAAVLFSEGKQQTLYNRIIRTGDAVDDQIEALETYLVAAGGNNDDPQVQKQIAKLNKLLNKLIDDSQKLLRLVKRGKGKAGLLRKNRTAMSVDDADEMVKQLEDFVKSIVVLGVGFDSLNTKP